MTKEEYVEKYTYGLDGQEPVPFDKVVEVLEDLAERGCGGTVALTASATNGSAAIDAGDGWVNITSSVNTKFVNLPAVADVEVGHVVRGAVGSNGVKIRVAKADDAAIYINADTTTLHGCTLAAGAMFKAELIDATHWVLFQITNAGTQTAPTPA